MIETMFAIEETTAAFEAARSVTDLPIVISFSYDRGTRTMMGVKPKDVMKRVIQGSLAAAVGSQPSSSIPRVVDAKTWVGILYAGLRRRMRPPSGRTEGRMP